MTPKPNEARGRLWYRRIWPPTSCLGTRSPATLSSTIWRFRRNAEHFCLGQFSPGDHSEEAGNRWPDVLVRKQPAKSPTRNAAEREVFVLAISELAPCYAMMGVWFRSQGNPDVASGAIHLEAMG